jgi:hypothetical protein
MASSAHRIKQAGNKCIYFEQFQIMLIGNPITASEATKKIRTYHHNERGMMKFDGKEMIVSPDLRLQIL